MMDIPTCCIHITELGKGTGRSRSYGYWRLLRDTQGKGWAIGWLDVYMSLWEREQIKMHQD